MKKFIFIIFILLLSGTSSYAVTRSGLAALEKIFYEGRYESVVSQSRWLIDAKAPNRDEIYYLKGLSEIKLGRFESARESFETIIKKFPSSCRIFDAYVGRGDAYFLQDETPKAVTAYNEALNTFSSHDGAAIVYHRLGNCCLVMGQREKADKYFAMAKAASPHGFENKNKVYEKGMPSGISAGRQADFSSRIKGQANISDGGGIFSVQAGSFKNMVNASRLAAKLSAEGFDGYVDSSASQDGLYRVRAGRFGSRDEAAEFSRRLNSRGYNTSIVVSD